MKEKKDILSNNLFLYLTEFFAGMSVMAVELGASRLLAPYFSSSQIVWTIIIGTIMIAMALGNIYGGKSADKDPNPNKLYRRIIIASIWIAAIPVLGKYIIMGIAAIVIFSVNTNFLICAAFAACMVVFVFPLFLLGTVTPSLVKYAVDNLDNNGKKVGWLNASNTIGSIIGTFVPTFITIPSVGTSITFLIFSGILMALAIIYFINRKSGRVVSAVGIVSLIICCFFGHGDSFAFWEDNLTFEGESVYNYLQVSEDDRSVTLMTNVLFGVQSLYMKDENSLTGMYYDYAMAAPMMADVNNKKKLDILVLGMGTGTFATQCNRYFDNIDTTGVEIDEKIIDLSRKYFDLDESIEVYAYDGRAFLNADKNTYDVIMVDAYQDITIPFQMSSVEFFTLVKNHLNENGVMVVNMNMRGENDSMNQYLADTISTVFSEVYTTDVDWTTNRELFASNNGDMLNCLSSNIDLEDNEKLVTLMDKVSNKLVKYEAGEHVMTDDKAPVELLSMSIIDDMIGEETEYYKDIYKEQGLEGLIKALQ